MRLPIRRPRLTLALAAIVVGLAGWSASRLEAVPSLAPMFATGDPASRAMVRMLDDFSAGDSLLMLVHAPAADETPIASLTDFAARLQTQTQDDGPLSRMIASLSYRPGDAVEDFVREKLVPVGLHYLSDAQFDQLEQRLSREGIRAQVRRNEGLIAAADPMAEAVSERVLRDPLRLHEMLIGALRPLEARFDMGQDQSDDAFIGDDGRSLLIQVRGTESAGELAFTRELMSRMREAVARAEPGALTVEYAGGYPIAELSERVIRRDMIVSVVCAVILLQLLFLIAYRGPWHFALTFVPVAGGILVGFGVYALLSARITPVTAASGAILAGLGVDYCIHYLSHYHTHRRASSGSHEAAEASLSLVPALGAACVTSLIGFGAIAWSQVPALRDFAVIGALGLAGAFCGAVVVLPALLRVGDRTGGPRRAAHEREANGWSMRWDVTPMVRWVGRRAGVCLGVAGVVTAAAVMWLIVMGLPAFESDMTVMQPRPSPPLEAQARIASRFGGATEPVPVHLEADSWPALVALAHEVDRRLMSPELAAGGVAPPMSVAMLLPEPNRAEARRARIASLDVDRILADFRGAIDDSAFDPRAYADYEVFLRRMLRPGPPPGVALLSEAPELAGVLLPRSVFGREGADRNDAPAQALTMVRIDHDASDPDARQAAIAQLESALAPVGGATVTGMDVVAGRVRATIETELPVLLSVAGAVVVAWLLIVFRRPGRVAGVAIPAVLCLVTVAVVMQATGTRLNPVNLLAIPLLAGIGVDDGIFLMSIAARHRDRATALAEHLAASCHAITMTSLTTLLAFGSLLLTNTPAIQSLGLVLTTGMIACWLASVFVLTPLLIVWNRSAGSAEPSDRRAG